MNKSGATRLSCDTLNAPTPTFDQLCDKDAGGMQFCAWLKKVGLSRSTGYRYRREGKIDTYNIHGIEFILTEEIVRFWQRVKRGEFAKKPRGASAKSRQSLKVTRSKPT